MWFSRISILFEEQWKKVFFLTSNSVENYSLTTSEKQTNSDFLFFILIYLYIYLFIYFENMKKFPIDWCFYIHLDSSKLFMKHLLLLQVQEICSHIWYHIIFGKHLKNRDIAVFF